MVLGFAILLRLVEQTNFLMCNHNTPDFCPTFREERKFDSLISMTICTIDYRYDLPEGELMDILCEVGVAARLGGSKISLYLDTINTEVKYTMARARNCACFVSSYKQKHSIYQKY